MLVVGKVKENKLCREKGKMDERIGYIIVIPAGILAF